MTSHSKVLRILDANLNRAGEGLRVLEEVARMVLDDPGLTGEFKSIRHDLVAAMKTVKRLDENLVMARAADRDVLRSGETATEQHRGNFLGLVRANASRSREALRVIEEYGKLLSSGLSGTIKALRFRLYDSEKGLVLRLLHRRRRAAALHGLWVHLEPEPDDASHISGWVTALAEAGTAAVVVGSHTTSDRAMLLLLEAARRGAGDDVLLISAGHPHCAVLAGADGVLLDTGDLPPETCRSIVGEAMLIAYRNTGPYTDPPVNEDVDIVVVSSEGDVSLPSAAVSSPVFVKLTENGDARIPNILATGAAGVMIGMPRPDDRTLERCAAVSATVRAFREHNYWAAETSTGGHTESS